MSSHAARDRAEEESYDWILAMDPLTEQPQPAARPDSLEQAQIGGIAAAEIYNGDGGWSTAPEPSESPPLRDAAASATPLALPARCEWTGTGTTPSRWRAFLGQAGQRGWCTGGGRDEWFLEGDPAWEKFVDAGGRPWWWRERDLRRPIFGRKKIKAVFDDFAAAGMKKVMDIVAARKESRGKFAMPTDAWKTKGRRTFSYLAVLLHYVDVDFQLKELCAGVLPIAGRKDYAFY